MALHRLRHPLAGEEFVIVDRSDDVAGRIRMLTARAMLRDGRDPLTVAEVTHIPQTLVELMRDIDADQRRRRRRAG